MCARWRWGWRGGQDDTRKKQPLESSMEKVRLFSVMLAPEEVIPRQCSIIQITEAASLLTGIT